MTPIAKTKRLILSAAAAIVLTGPAFAGPFIPLPSPLPFGGGFQVDPNLFLPRYPDLAITNVHATRSSNWVYLRVTVTNVGRADWRSGANQQGVLATAASESRSLWGRLTYVRAGASVLMTGWVRNQWYPGNEFAPNLRVRLSFAPDLSLDGNPSNDDRNRFNNSRTLTAARMHDLLY